MYKYFISLSILFILMACSSNRITDNMPAEKKMEIGNNFFDEEKFNKAIPYYTDVAFERNSSFTTEAQEKLAECYFRQDKYLEARFEYQELIRLFPDHEDIGRIYFQVGVCYFNESLNAHYSQDDTEKAISSFKTFLEKFPFDERKVEALEYLQKCNYKLLEKKFHNGLTYYRIYDYSAALMYFDEIIDLEMNDVLDRKAIYYSAKIYKKRKNIEKTQKMIEILNKKYPGSKETLKAVNFLKKQK
ncbi:MAG: outer membrane protein assembly factor BamD [Candidatus Cloacimonetes bacterium]|nr:outer membrane protein assembly factor BamD [Candidatus Cloacimonadota bacterium]